MGRSSHELPTDSVVSYLNIISTNHGSFSGVPREKPRRMLRHLENCSSRSVSFLLMLCCIFLHLKINRHTDRQWLPQLLHVLSQFYCSMYIATALYRTQTSRTWLCPPTTNMHCTHITYYNPEISSISPLFTEPFGYGPLKPVTQNERSYTRCTDRNVTRPIASCCHVKQHCHCSPIAAACSQTPAQHNTDPLRR